MSKDKKDIKLVLDGRISEFKKPKNKFDGGDVNVGNVECFVIEKAMNGYILRMIGAAQDPEMDSMVESILVFTEKDELIEMLTKNL